MLAPKRSGTELESAPKRDPFSSIYKDSARGSVSFEEMAMPGMRTRRVSNEHNVIITDVKRTAVLRPL